MSTSPRAPTIRVLIADDQRVVREGLHLLVDMIDGVHVIGTVSDGVEAVQVACTDHPDLVLMDLRMPNLDGVAATAALAERAPLVRVLVLTTYADDQSIFPALQAGARGYLTKDASADEIEHAIRAVAAGQTYLDRVVQERLVEAVTDQSPPIPRASREMPEGLTEREAEVLTLIGQGLSNTQIASRLYLSNATVKSHINKIFAKTGVRDRGQAVRFAFDHGLVAPTNH